LPFPVQAEKKPTESMINRKPAIERCMNLNIFN